MDSGQTITLFAENEPFRATKVWNNLVKNFKTGVRLKKKRWRMKYYEDCFSGSEALAWIHDFLKFNPNFGQNVSKTQAKQLCQKLLERNVFEDVALQSSKSVFEECHLYTFTSKARRKVLHEKENSWNSKSKKAVKRHSSFSNRFTRKPLGDRNIPQNTSKDAHVKKSDSKEAKLTQDADYSELDSLETSNSVLANGGLNTNDSELGLQSKRWKSQYDVRLMKDENYEDDVECEEFRSPSKELINKQITSVIAELVPKSDAHLETKTVNNCQEGDSQISQTDVWRAECGSCGHKQREHEIEPNLLWINVCVERLQQALKVDSLEDILDVNLLSWKNVMDNVASNFRCVTEAHPKWLISAMKCLIHWPQSIDSRPSHVNAGFENDVFKTIREHYQLLLEPLVTSNFINVFAKISGTIAKCKLSAIRALQLTFLLLGKHERRQLQLLLRFMIKVSNNHQLNLNGPLPTRELAIQTFLPCIFGEKESVHEILGIRITSFIMENYAEVFKVPDGLKYEVEQQIAFRYKRNERALQSNDVAFCLRVTKQEYEEQKQLGTQRFLEDLLHNIVHDEKMSAKERKKKLKQFEKMYPEIYFRRFSEDGLSVISVQQPVKLRRVLRPLARKNVKYLR